MINQEGSVFPRLRAYFQSVADSLNETSGKAAIYPNNSDKGIQRENIFVGFLEGYLPARCKVIRGGFVFDSLGNGSNQIDILVTNDLTLQFEPKDLRSFSCIEGCYASISIKSNL